MGTPLPPRSTERYLQMPNIAQKAICFSLFYLCCTLVWADISITHFYDGDTVKIRDEHRQYALRISDIDAPERNQKYGKQARRALMKLCKQADIEVSLKGVDKYQRDLGDLYCNGVSASGYMIEHGYAWYNVRYAHNGHLQNLENSARAEKRGLWKQKRPMPPWIWRQKHTHK
jgi:endonuclease YncB( thermonuclease family)